MARRSGQPKELIRLSPLQFSLSISIVVILLGGAGLAGYYYGQKRAIVAMDSTEAVSADLPGEKDVKPGTSGTQTPVTFYSTLTKPSEDIPTPKHPEPARNSGAKTRPKPVPELPSESGLGEHKGLILQVASYQQETSARKLLEELSSEGYKGTVMRSDLGERGVWFRVRIGPFASGSEAKTVLEKLRNERSLKGYIVK